MKQWLALSAIGRDQPGIVADLAERIDECGCNLEDSSMTILSGEFAGQRNGHLHRADSARHSGRAVGISTLHQRLDAIADRLHIHIDLISMAGQEDGAGANTTIRRQR